jgi:predicted nucleic acid-binding protein
MEKVVIDANIVIAAIIKEGFTKKVLANPNLELYAPSLLFEELEEHSEEIIIKSKRSEHSFYSLLAMLRKRIKIVPESYFKNEIQFIESVCPDRDDRFYIALAYKLKIPLWSNNKILKSQKVVRVYNTQEMVISLT